MSVRTAAPATTSTPAERARTRSPGLWRRRLPIWGLTVVVGLTALMWVYPFLWMLSASLKDQLEVFTAGLDLIPAKA